MRPRQSCLAHPLLSLLSLHRGTSCPGSTYTARFLNRTIDLVQSVLAGTHSPRTLFAAAAACTASGYPPLGLHPDGCKSRRWCDVGSCMRVNFDIHSRHTRRHRAVSIVPSVSPLRLPGACPLPRIAQVTRNKPVQRGGGLSAAGCQSVCVGGLAASAVEVYVLQ